MLEENFQICSAANDSKSFSYLLDLLKVYPNDELTSFLLVIASEGHSWRGSFKLIFKTAALRDKFFETHKQGSVYVLESREMFYPDALFQLSPKATLLALHMFVVDPVKDEADTCVVSITSLGIMANLEKWAGGVTKYLLGEIAKLTQPNQPSNRGVK